LKRILLVFASLILFLTIYPEQSQAATVYWDGVELKKGQIGRVTVMKPINLWKRTASGIEFERVLQPGEKYRVYRIDDLYGGQYGVGGNLYITKIPKLVKYETPSASKKKLLDCGQACLVDSIVVLPKEYNEASVNKIKNRLAVLPETLLSKLNNHPIKIKLTNGPVTDTAEYAHLKGVAPRGWEKTHKTWDDVPGIGGGKTVVVRIGYSEQGSGHGSVNLELHELAHSIDNLLEGHISYSQAFLAIWNEEKSKLFPGEDYFYKYPEEYLAEAFALYYRDGTSRNKLQTKAPKTYQIIKNMN